MRLKIKFSFILLYVYKVLVGKGRYSLVHEDNRNCYSGRAYCRPVLWGLNCTSIEQAIAGTSSREQFCKIYLPCPRNTVSSKIQIVMSFRYGSSDDNIILLMAIFDLFLIQRNTVANNIDNDVISLLRQLLCHYNSFDGNFQSLSDVVRCREIRLQLKQIVMSFRCYGRSDVNIILLIAIFNLCLMQRNTAANEIDNGFHDVGMAAPMSIEYC